MGRGQQLARVAAVLSLFATAACSLLVSADGLVGGTPADDAGTPGDATTDPREEGAPGDASTVTDAQPDAADPWACPKTEPGLVVRYAFDDGQGSSVTDCSGNGNTGTVVGGKTWSAGKHGGALTFNGTDTCVAVSNQNGFASNQVTVAAWVNVTAYRASGIKGYIAGKTTDPFTLGWRLATDDPGLFESRIGNAADAAAAFVLASPSGNPTGTWMHVAGVFVSGQRAEIWVNGTRVANAIGAPSIAPDNGASLRIGCNNGSPLKDFFSGQLDELRIYTRALTAQEIGALAQ